jgi:hypothetical protein
MLPVAQLAAVGARKPFRSAAAIAGLIAREVDVAAEPWRPEIPARALAVASATAAPAAARATAAFDPGARTLSLAVTNARPKAWTGASITADSGAPRSALRSNGVMSRITAGGRRSASMTRRGSQRSIWRQSPGCRGWRPLRANEASKNMVHPNAFISADYGQSRDPAPLAAGPASLARDDTDAGGRIRMLTAKTCDHGTAPNFDADGWPITPGTSGGCGWRRRRGTA